MMTCTPPKARIGCSAFPCRFLYVLVTRTTCFTIYSSVPKVFSEMQECPSGTGIFIYETGIFFLPMFYSGIFSHPLLRIYYL